MQSQMDLFDIDLLLASRAGAASAFAELYRRHSRAVLRYAWGRLGREDLAEEAMQDTFVVAWERRDRAPIVDESLLPFLLAVCRNHVANQIRKSRRTRAVVWSETMAAPMRDDDLTWMRIELDKLSPIDRRLCELCLGDGVSYKDAARIIDSTDTAVGKRLQRSRIRLRVALGKED